MQFVLKFSCKAKLKYVSKRDVSRAMGIPSSGNSVQWGFLVHTVLVVSKGIYY